MGKSLTAATNSAALSTAAHADGSGVSATIHRHTFRENADPGLDGADERFNATFDALVGV